MSNFKKHLEGIFGNDAVKKAVIWLVVVIVGIAVVLTQFVFPMHASYGYAKICRYSGQNFETNIKGVYEKIAAGNSENGVILSDTVFDMSKESEYLRIELAFYFSNIGMYKVSDIQFSVDCTGEYKGAFVFKEGNMSGIDRFSDGVVSLFVVICTDGLTNKQINEAINSMTVTYSFDRPELFASSGSITLPEINLPFDDIIEK